ncbi:MAG: protein kinase [Planctomycetaceae bacterium]|jgi:WD40 repeat protein/serine/threonine protein kinase|nr:protein kinase [Planctomycetaceae bacterium]
MFKTVCPHCSQEYTLDDALLGKTASCKRCRNIFTLERNQSTKLVRSSQTQPNEDSGFDLQPNPDPTKHVREEPRQQIPNPKFEKRFSPESGIWNIGDVVLGVYEVKPIAPDIPFAEGGVGVVHRVYHREWDRDLAVKSPKPQVFQTENGKQSYEKEAQTWIELGLHPNIVTCYLVRRISNIPRLFAEFVPDGSLRDWIRDGRLYEGGHEASLLRILNIATQFAWGLEHAHRQKLLHLDVKPANVMMAGQTAKVTDFGLAQGIADLQDSQQYSQPSNQPPQQNYAGNTSVAEIGASGMTPGYCSPEQYYSFLFAQRQEFDKMPKITFQSDIWSWAVSVLAMFHGRPPCKKGGQTARKVFEIYLQGTPDKKNLKMPEPVIELMFRCFEEEPQKRPDSMACVADELTKIYREISGVAFPRSRPINATWTPESINNRAASMLDLNKPVEAAQLLDQASALQPWHPEVTYNQTLLAWRTARLTDLAAIERIETLVKTRPQSSSALYALGLAQRERGNPPSAIDAFENAITLESREEIRRALLATEKIVSKNARCLERITVARGMEDEIMIDERGECILLPNTEQTFDLRETATGRIRHSFNPPNEKRKQQFPDRIALSEDLLWELVRGEKPGTVLMKRVGQTPPTSCFRLIGWKRYFGRKEGHTLRELITRSEIAWIGEIKENRVDLFDKETKKKIGDLFGHEDIVTALTFSADGRFALSGSSDRTMRLWELPSGRCLRTFTSLGGAVDAVHFGCNNRFALSLIAGGSLRLWDISILCENRTLFRAPLLLSHIASAEEIGRQQSVMNQYCEEIRQNIIESNFDAVIRTVAKARVLAGWESSRKLLETEGVWDVLKRHTVRESLEDVLCTHTFVGHQDTVSAISISPDSHLIASAGRDTTIRIWNLNEQKCTGVLEGHSDWVRSVEMTMDAKFLVSGSWDMTVRVWNIGSGQCVRKFDEKIKSLTKIALNPHGRLVAIANGTGSVVLWDVLTDEIKGRFLAHSGSVNSIRFNRNGHYLITGGDDNIVAIWKLGSEEPVWTINVHKSPVTAAVLSTDFTKLVSADREGRIVVWNLQENKMDFELLGHFGDVTGLELLADNRFFLSSAKDTTIRLEGVQNRSIQRVIEGHSSPVLAMALDVTGRHFVTGCEDAVVRVWDLYWNYKFPGWSPMTPEAETILKMLLSLYSPDVEGCETPQVDAAILKRITLEMEYRGFGMILPEERKQTITRLLNTWEPPNTYKPQSITRF